MKTVLRPLQAGTVAESFICKVYRIQILLGYLNPFFYARSWNTVLPIDPKEGDCYVVQQQLLSFN